MQKIMYLSQNTKGFSIDDIKASDLLGQTVSYLFDTIHGDNNKLTLSSSGTVYSFLIEDSKGNNLWGKGSGQMTTITELKDYIRKELWTLGFKERKTDDVLIKDVSFTNDDFNSFSNNMKNIIDELNIQNGSNYKLETLKSHSGNELLKRLLKMTYDNVSHTYGITMKNINYTPNEGKSSLTLSEALDKLENDFCTRKVTGNEALIELTQILESLSKEEAEILSKVIDRDLKINMGTSNINKVFKDLIVKPVYMRCGVFTPDTTENGKLVKGTSRDINPQGAFIQLKADGTYREVTVDTGHVRFNSRSGEEYEYPILAEFFKKLPEGKYIGELTVEGITNRAEGNGLINQKPEDVPHDRIIMEVWDYVSLMEYSNAAGKTKNTTKYEDRFAQLSKIISTEGKVKVIESYRVKSIAEALEYVSRWMNAGLEGGILKDKDGLFRDGTSKHQLKLKLQVDAEMRITGFTEGKKGTSREKTFGAITFQNDEGTIKGQTSGFTDEQLNDFNSRREELIGKVMTVQFNDVTKGRDNDYYALSHPRFIEFRNDKNETDTLEKVLEMKKMAMNLS